MATVMNRFGIEIRKVLATLAVIALLVSLALPTGCSDASRGKPLGATQTLELTINGKNKTFEFETLDVTINGRAFKMKLALTDLQRYNGLSHMTNEQIGDGMLFAFEDAKPLDFVMRDCLVPIDIIFVSPAGRVIQTHEMQTEPPGTVRHRSYPSRYPALVALEFQAGTIKSLDIKPGQAIDLPMDRLKQRAD